GAPPCGGIRASSSWLHPCRETEVATGDIDELRVAPRRTDRDRMADGPDDQAGDPEAQAETDRARQRAVDDSERPRCAAEQHRLGQRPVDRREIAGDRLDRI